MNTVAIWQQKANQLSGGQDPNVLDTLAAAYAETGQFAEAAGLARRALVLARRSDAAELTVDLQARLRLYQSGYPYRESAGVNQDVE